MGKILTFSFSKCTKDQWLKLTLYDQSSKPFELQSEFVHQGYLPLPLSIYMLKISQSLNFFFSETARPICTRFYTGPSVEGVLSICSNRSASLNKMATMPIYDGKTLKIFFSRPKKALRQKLVTEHCGLMVIQVCPNDDPRLTCELFYSTV